MSWVAVEGFEGRYAVSEDGQVMSLSTYRGRAPKIMRQRKRRGYLSVCVGKRSVTVHALVARAFIGPRPDGMQINHVDGNKENNAVCNLEYVTRSENQKHSFRVGLQCNQGERHSQHKLNDEIIRDIRERLAHGDSQKEIATSVGVHRSWISRIKNREAWSHVS